MKPAEVYPRYQELIVAIGEKIKDLRKEKNISYIKMAEEIGISRNGYNNIELAKSNFQFETLYRIITYHHITVFEFFESIKR